MGRGGGREVCVVWASGGVVVSVFFFIVLLFFFDKQFILFDRAGEYFSIN